MPEQLVTGRVTSIEDVAVCEPSCVVAVIVADPAAIPETSPEEFTVAAAVLLELQLTFLLVAFEGVIVAVNCFVVLISMEEAVGDTVTPVTGILRTVIDAIAVWLPFCVVTVMFAVPGETPVTNPVPSTVATAVLLEFQLTVFIVAFSGATVAVNCCVAPVMKEAVVGDTVTLLTGTMEDVTVTSAVAVKLPSTVFTVMVVVPMVRAVTIPPELTVATAVLPDEYVTDRLLALEGVTVGVSCCVAPPASETVEGANVTPVTGTTTHVSDSVRRLSK